MARLSRAGWVLAAEEAISFPCPNTPSCRLWHQDPGCRTLRPAPFPAAWPDCAGEGWEGDGLGLIYLAATKKEGSSSLEAPIWVCGRNKVGWVRGQLRECGDHSQMWAEPLRKELCSAAPESTSVGARPASEAGVGVRGTEAAAQSGTWPGLGGSTTVAPGAKSELSAISPALWVSLPSDPSCLPPRTEQMQEGQCLILRARSWGSHWGGATRLGRATSHQPEPSRCPSHGHWQGTQTVCCKGHPTPVCLPWSVGRPSAMHSGSATYAEECLSF